MGFRTHLTYDLVPMLKPVNFSGGREVGIASQLDGSGIVLECLPRIQLLLLPSRRGGSAPHESTPSGYLLVGLEGSPYHTATGALMVGWGL